MSSNPLWELGALNESGKALGVRSFYKGTIMQGRLEYLCLEEWLSCRRRQKIRRLCWHCDIIVKSWLELKLCGRFICVE
jgi:hypothetical protein